MGDDEDTKDDPHHFRAVQPSANVVALVYRQTGTEINILARDILCVFVLNSGLPSNGKIT
jgi:hypothetical protein